MVVSDLIVLVFLFFFCSAVASLETNVIPENSGYISKILAILKIEGVGRGGGGSLDTLKVVSWTFEIKKTLS